MVCRKHLDMWLLLGLMLLSSASIAIAAGLPEGPTTLTIDATSRRTAVTSPTLEAVAGNVTQLTVAGSTVTQTWQGYYGNVTGTVTLDDANNNTMYDWSLASPEGEIYASQAAVTWTSGNVKCYDLELSDGSYSAHVTLAELEASLGLASDDVDGVDETFPESTSYDSFYAGEYLIDATCPTTQTYNGSEVKDANSFQEVLLYDNTSNEIVYAAIIEETEPVGFNDQNWDFQMLVGEDGHNGDTSTTTYYFYVELE
ncbi:hypothetical protein KY359_06065 [Candidatus Woesearchaeota archaeon]|nr:hypothetical protein [Candidatus Woesearchaeota archaeon]